MSNDDEKRAHVTEHLAELRARLIRSIIYLLIGAVAAWFCYDYLLDFLTRPMMGVLDLKGAKFLLTSFPEPFMIQLQTCIVAGLVICFPAITAEIWGFVSPGLTPNERGPLKWIMPLAALLFCAGVVVCYLILPKAFEWFAAYVPRNAELRPSLQQSVLFTVKMLLAFGIVFELPVVLMLLAKVGIVNSRMLLSNWRGAMVGISIVSAIITPSNDAFSMLMMAIPVSGLYFMSILLVRLVESDSAAPGLVQRLFARFRRKGN